jgi:hypothetical protein
MAQHPGDGHSTATRLFRLSVIFAAAERIAATYSSVA